VHVLRVQIRRRLVRCYRRYASQRGPLAKVGWHLIHAVRSRCKDRRFDRAARQRFFERLSLGCNAGVVHRSFVARQERLQSWLTILKKR